MDRLFDRPAPATNSTLEKLRSLALSESVLVTLGLFLIVAALWIPFGLKVGYVVDGWEFFAQADRNEMFVFPARPFVPLGWVIAYAIAPGSFVGSNVMLILLIFGKGWLSYHILKQLRCHSAFAFAGAALITVYAADSGIFYQGALAIHFALFFYMLALYFLLLYWKRRQFRYAIAMSLAQVVCVLTYEAAYPLILFSPLLLLFINRRDIKRFILTTIVWYEIPALAIVRFALLAASQPENTQYQSGLFGARGTIGEITSSLLTVYQKHFVTSWLPDNVTPTLLLIAAVSGVVVFIICRRLQKSHTEAELLPDSRQYLGFMVGGIVVLTLGFGVYLLTALRDDDLRTYYFSSVGAGVSVAAVIGWFSTVILRRPAVFAVGMATLCGLASLRLLEQHQSYDERSERQQALATALVETLRGVERGSAIVVLDETENRQLATEIGSSWTTQNLMQILYEDFHMGAVLCYPQDTDIWGGFREDCTFETEMVTVINDSIPFMLRPYDQLIVVRYTEEDGFSIVDDISAYVSNPEALNVYQPERLLIPNSGVPQRLQTLFGN